MNIYYLVISLVIISKIIIASKYLEDIRVRIDLGKNIGRKDNNIKIINK